MPEISPANAKAVNVRDIIESQKNKPSKVKIIRSANDTLDKNSFLKLLVTELSHQDPMQPVNDREFISQMAQFSSLEQMNNIANSMNRLRSFQANTLVGKYVTGKDFVNGKMISGNVSQVIYDSKGNVFLKVNGRSMKLDEITSVEEKKQTNSMINSNKNYSNVSRETIGNQYIQNQKTESNQANITENNNKINDQGRGN